MPSYWDGEEKRRQCPAWESPRAVQVYHQPQAHSLTQQVLCHTLKCLWLKKHTHICSKGRCHGNDTFFQKMWELQWPAGSEYNHTGICLLSGLFDSWSQFRDRYMFCFVFLIVVTEQINLKWSLHWNKPDISQILRLCGIIPAMVVIWEAV